MDIIEQEMMQTHTDSGIFMLAPPPVWRSYKEALEGMEDTKLVVKDDFPHFHRVPLSCENGIRMGCDL